MTAERAESAIYPLPASPAHIVGREEIVAEVCRRAAGGLLSIVGPGGIGKTTVAVSVANALLKDYDGAVCFLELSGVDDPQLIDPTVAAAFGVPIQSSDPISGLVTHLQDKRALLILDSCEHVVSKVAALVERLLGQLPDLHILATSREALGADGEYVLRLPPLGSPPDTPNISARIATSYPAVQLFAQRAASAGARIAVNDEMAPLVARMCRKLGGIPLAIELVAAQVADHGVRETAALLDNQFALRWPGRRTAPPRHQTLKATLDWSYNLLSDGERSVLRQLSVFAGGFTSDAAQAVVSAPGNPTRKAADVVADLFAKSLVSADSAPAKRYRLLDSTRAYAALKLTDHAERRALKRRHALYLTNWLQKAAADANAVKRELSQVKSETDNVRVALDWAFSAEGDRSIAVDLAVNSAPLWLGQALFTECRDWMLKAATLPRSDETRQRLLIQMALASAELFSVGLSKETAATFVTALELAERVGDAAAQFACLLVMWGWEIRETWYSVALVTAERCAKAANAAGDRGALAMSDWMVGHTQHQLGLLEASRHRLQRALDTDPEEARAAQTAATGYDRKVDGLGLLSNTLWTQGLFDQARRLGTKAVEEARALGLASPFGVAMIWAGLNNYFAEADGGIERDMAELVEHGRAHSLKSEEGFAQCILGLCQIRRGRFETAVPTVHEGLRLLADAHVLSFSPVILAHLAEATATAGRHGEAHALIERLSKEDRNAEHWCTPEILRVRAVLTAAAGDQRSAEQLLREALAMAAKQGALAWQLKSATAFASLLLAQQRRAEARHILAPIYESIAEGHDVLDVRAAKKMLDELTTTSPH